MAKPLGYLWLIEHFRLAVVPHHVASYEGPVPATQALAPNWQQARSFRAGYVKHDTPIEHLEFALKHEGINPEIICRALERLDPRVLCAHIESSPIGRYARQLGFWYERLLDEWLPLAGPSRGNYVDLLDPEAYFSAVKVRDTRWRVNDNLLGDRRFAPIVRRTERLKDFQTRRLDQRARSIVGRYGEDLIRRAGQYLYERETRSSFAIEHERPSRRKAERFVQLLRRAGARLPLTEEVLVGIQNAIIDDNYRRDVGYRANQNYVGEPGDIGPHQVHYVPPRPEDIPSMMAGWKLAADRMNGKFDPVVEAAVLSFGFVYIHPFEDGNGRLHRFLIHHVLARRGFVPEGLIFPVSATMLEHRKAYDAALERLSQPLRAIADFDLHPGDGTMHVHNDLAAAYRFVDLTAQAEYLYEAIEHTLDNTFRVELDLLERYDRIRQALDAEIDLADKDRNLLIWTTLKNGGIFPKRRYRQFDHLQEPALQRAIEIIETLAGA